METGAVDFTCEGCGAEVSWFGLDRVPAHRFCATCLWLHETDLTPEEFWTLYKRTCIEPDGRTD